jgi:hypothetical protein
MDATGPDHLRANFQSTTPDAARAEAAEAPYGWILHPAIDLLFCCGGLAWVFAAVCYAVGDAWTGDVGKTLLAMNAIAVLLVGDSHTAATLKRVYTEPTLYKAIGKFSNISAVVMIALFVAALNYVPLTVFLFKIYLYWLAQHYLAQSFGITMIYLYKRGYTLQKWERDVLFWLHYVLLAYMIVSTCTFQSAGATTAFPYALALPFWGPLHMWVYNSTLFVLQALVMLFLFIVSRKYLNEGKVLPLPAAMMIVTSVAIYCLGWYSTMMLIFLTTVWHGSQYLCVTTALHIKQKGRRALFQSGDTVGDERRAEVLRIDLHSGVVDLARSAAHHGNLRDSNQRDSDGASFNSELPSFHVGCRNLEIA